MLYFMFVLQSHIFLLNCDVCCNFPLPDMLGGLDQHLIEPCLLDIKELEVMVLHIIIWQDIKGHYFFLLDFLSEAHKGYGGMGTMLVIKV